MTILLVDDDLDDIELFSEALKEVDGSAQLITAHHGIDALNLLEKQAAPDLILLDINMPLMGGVECLEKIKERDDLRTIPVTMYTTSENPIERVRCFDLGADLWVKPSSYSSLLSTLQMLVKV